MSSHFYLHIFKKNTLFQKRVFYSFFCLSIIIFSALQVHGDSGYTNSYRTGDASYRSLSNNLGLYYAFSGFNHTGIVGYVGSSDESSWVYEMAFGGCNFNTMAVHKAAGHDQLWYGVYTVEGGLSDEERTEIRNVASDIYDDTDISYTFDDVLKHESNIGYTLERDEITDLRCDGLVEFAYESLGHRVWGPTVSGSVVNWDISITDNVDDHADFGNDDPWRELSPCIQRGGGYQNSPYTNFGPSFPPPTKVRGSNGSSTSYVEVTWDSVSGVDYYRVYRATSKDGTKSAMGVWQDVTTYYDTSATPGTTYYYWVKPAENSSGRNAGGFSEYTTGYRQVSKPSEATSPSPSSGATSQSISTDISWSDAGGATSYDVYFGTDASPDSGEEQGTQTSTSYNPGTLNYSTTYYWRIDAVNAGGTTTGTVWHFTTEAEPVSPPSAATNPSPANGSSGQSIDTEISWSGGSDATSYDVFFGTDSSPDNEEHKVTQTSTSYDPGILNYSTKYYWRIDAVNEGGRTPGDVWHFTTQCDYAIKPTRASLGALEDTVDVEVNASSSSCSWTVTDIPSWVELSQTSGTGDDIVTITVSANSGASRSGTVTIAGETFSISQDEVGCSYEITKASHSFDALGDTVTVGIEASSSSCSWSASSIPSWVELSKTSGTGSDTVDVTVSTNTGAARSDTMRIAGKKFSISQDELDCSYDITPESQSFDASEGTVNIEIEASSSLCSWSATDIPSWVELSETSGTGNGTVTLTVSANAGYARTGTVTIAENSFSVSQAATENFNQGEIGEAVITGCSEVNGYWNFDAENIENMVDVTGNGYTLTLTDVAIADGLSNSGISFSASLQSAVLDFDETAAGQGIGFWVYLPQAQALPIVDLEYEVQVTELIFNGTSFEVSEYPLNYNVSLSVTEDSYILECADLSYSTSLPRGEEEQWVFVKLDVSVTDNVIDFTLGIYETDQWLSNTDQITIDNNGNVNIQSVDFQKWLSAAFTGSDNANWLLDELALTSYDACSKDIFINSALAATAFNYTFKITDQYGKKISDSELNIVEIAQYQLDNGVLTITESPMNVNLIPQAENYQFEQVNMSMPWNDCTVNLVAVNGPPVNQAITSNAVTHVNEVILFSVSASDIETETIQFQVDSGDGSVSDWFTGNSYNYTYITSGDFEVKVRAKDETGNISKWSASHVVTVLDEFAGNIIIIDESNPTFESSSISAGTQVIIRPTENPIELSGDLTLEDGAELMLDGGSLTMIKGSTLTLNGSSRLQTAGGAVLILGDLVSDNLSDSEWWTNENRNTIKLLDTQVYFYNFQTVSKSFTAENTDFDSLAEDATVQGAAGDSVTFSVKSIDSLILTGTTDFDIKAGDGCPSTTYVKGGNGGAATLMLYSYDEVLSDIYGDFDVWGGNGEDGYNAGNSGISDSGDGGDVIVHVVANNNCYIGANDFDIEGGHAAYGVDDDDDEDGSQAGKPGDVNLLLESWSSDIELHDISMDVECQDTRDGGSSEEDSGHAGTIGADSTVVVRAANNIVMVSVSLDVEAGDGGDGGDGDNAGNGAAGGDIVFTLDCTGQLTITGSNFDVFSGDGGSGGDGETGGSSSTAYGGVGAAGGSLTANINCGQLICENSSFDFEIGGGGDGGDPYETKGSKGGDSGTGVFSVNADSLQFASVQFDIYGSDAGDGSDGDDSDSDNGAIGGNGAALDINWNILGNIELDNSDVDIKSASAGSAGSGENTVNGASASTLTFNLISSEGSFISNNSQLSIEAGNGEDGGYAYDDDGGDGGAAGIAVFNCDIFGSIDITSGYNDNGSLVVESGAGGNGGRGKDGYGGTPKTGGNTQCSLTAGDYVHFDDAFVHVIGGEGGNGQDGEDDSHDSNGAKGGAGTLTITSPDITMTKSRVIATGGRGGNGVDKYAGAGGNGAINVVGDTVVGNSSLIATHGQPGQDDDYRWGGQGTGNITVTGLLEAVGSIVGKKITGSTDINLSTPNFYPFSNIATSRGAAWTSKYPWNFLTLESVAPGYTAHTYKLVYNLSDDAWTFYIDGSIPETYSAVQFEECYDANGIKFTMGPSNYITWSDGDTLTFSSQMPVVAVNSGTATVDQPIRVIPAMADYSLYEGTLDVQTFASDGTVTGEISYATSPYYISIPGWTVDSSGTIVDLALNSDSYKIFAEDYVSDFFNYVECQSYIIVLLKSDFDNDGLADEEDTDDDNDYYLDEEDAFPLDPDEWLDTDEDGIGNNADTDDDDDGLSDDVEDANQNGVVDDGETNPLDADSDNDGLSDGDEVNIYGTDPNDSDSDGDGISDGDEIVNGTDPNSQAGDYDADGDFDGVDIYMFIDEYGRTDCSAVSPCVGNFDGDNDVDQDDLELFTTHFGQ